MKTCPTCSKTYEDSMRFCQIDGTLLIDEAPAFDPYATIVGKVAPPPAAEQQPAPPPAQPEYESPIHATVGSIPISEPDDVLDLPSSDPLKTMYVSEAEMREALDKPDIIEIPPIAAEPAPPSFIASEPPPPYEPQPYSEPEPPQAAAAEPPPSPFGNYSDPAPMSSPFDERPSYAVGEAPMTKPAFSEPEPVRFDEAATMMQPDFSKSFDQPTPVAQWQPQAALPAESNWQNPPAAAEAGGQFQPVAGADGANKSLAVASLVLGLLSFLCLGFLGSIPAIILGFMQKSKIKGDPREYGGSGFATAGIVLGFLNIVVTIIVLILYAGIIMANMR